MRHSNGASSPSWWTSRPSRIRSRFCAGCAIRAVKKQIEATRHEIENAERAADYGRAAELKYGRVVALERELQEAEQSLATAQGELGLASGEVTEEDIAEVVSRWTHIP